MLLKELHDIYTVRELKHLKNAAGGKSCSITTFVALVTYNIVSMTGYTKVLKLIIGAI